jgi:hypothetical protein
MAEAAMIFTEDMTEDDMIEMDEFNNESRGSNEIGRLSDEELEQKLNEALQVEDYQRAAILRDELNKRK